jgi:hypothetical protein
MAVTDEGEAKVTLARFLQLANALDSIVVTDAGMVTLVRPEFINAVLPMVVTDEGMVTLVRLLLENAECPISVIPEGMVTSVSS